MLGRLLGADVRYLFVSNSDNLGATLDLTLLAHFAGSGDAFLMEVREREELVHLCSSVCVHPVSELRLTLRCWPSCPTRGARLPYPGA